MNKIMRGFNKNKKVFHLKNVNKQSKILLSIIILFLFNTSELFPVESWPSDGDWVTMRDYNWVIYPNTLNRIRERQVDLVPDSYGVIAYYWSSETSLFFRMTLRETVEFFGRLKRGSWFIVLDTDMDNYMDWLIQLEEKTQSLLIYPNEDSYPDNSPDKSENFTVPSPISAGYVRVLSAGTAANPFAVYLDIQVPFSALQKTAFDKNISYTTPFLMYYATNKDDRLKIKDILGSSRSFDGAFRQAMLYTPSRLTSFGRFYDTRDANSYTDGGVWFRNEDLTVSGLRWPTYSSPYYNNGNRNVKITDSDNNTIWSGFLTTTTSGTFQNYSLTSLELSLLPGIYNIQIENPLIPGEYNTYDFFEIKAPIISVGKATSTPVLSSGSNAGYSIQINNTGNIDGILTTITDILPYGFTYVSGSSHGLTTSDPIINGNQISWQGNWNVPVSGSINQDFLLKSSLVRDEYLNNATIGGDNFAVKNTGPTAGVQVKAPVLSLVKSVDIESVTPGEIMTYTVNYSNVGDDNASIIFILEKIPETTEYIVSSADGDEMTITYSHDGGISFDSNQTSAVTDISFQRTTVLTPGSTGAVTFKVKVK
ncbi:MAG: hypothetical protein DRP93_02980 [Candidatus Neomarinimicrobiota bacterium]|nr:MAG: hypothetical protein DRP93_02980 [Candidatus Neomarinimicrobiota bacterium]